ncbi:hypothetical protein L3Q67_41380 [Saccharothrix sp. AJ9571]|nr:hypothetical protein L3Q67_41380 [Saccharothrix sp. AJ9571]
MIATFGFGWLADRCSDRVLIITTMAILALGACGNGIRTLEAVTFPRCFGLSHLGAICGVVHSVTVGASAFGPLLLAFGRDHATTYRPVLLVTTALPLAVIIAGALVRTPPPGPGHASRDSAPFDSPVSWAALSPALAVHHRNRTGRCLTIRR